MKTITMSYDEYVKEIEELKNKLESKNRETELLSIAAKEYRNKGIELLNSFENYIQNKEQIADWQSTRNFIEKLVPSTDLFWK